MTGIIITGHGTFPDGFLSACRLIAGDLDHFFSVCFDKEPEQLEAGLKQAVSACDDCDRIIIFCDIPGGTPFKTAAMLAAEDERIEVIAGVNLPLLLEIALGRESSSDCSSLLDDALNTAKDQILRLDCKALLQSEEEEEPEDGI